MRRESFHTPGPLRLDVRVPSGRIDLESVEGEETIVELEASAELEEEARIELRPKRDGHEVSVVSRTSRPASTAPRRPAARAAQRTMAPAVVPSLAPSAQWCHQ